MSAKKLCHLQKSGMMSIAVSLNLWICLQPENCITWSRWIMAQWFCLVVNLSLTKPTPSILLLKPGQLDLLFQIQEDRVKVVCLHFQMVQL